MSIIDKIVGDMVASGTLTARARAEGKRTAKKARRAARHRAKQELSAAVAADNWEDRPDSGKSRPTAERKDKGRFVLRDGEDAGVSIAVDEAAHILDVLHSRGVITGDQRDAGHDIAALLERTRLVSAGRSCLDFTPVGHDDNREPTHGELRDTQERNDLYLGVGMLTFRELRHVCHEGNPPRSVDRLRDGLTFAAKMWG